MNNDAIIERVITLGDLSALTVIERTQYYIAVCNSIGVNPLTRPFDYLSLGDGDKRKLVLYPNAECAAQLRANNDISISIISRDVVEGIYVVVAKARMGNGREDEASGCVPLVKENGTWERTQSGKSYFKGDGTFASLSPTDRANAMMKAETKAKRRAAFSACGLGIAESADSDDPAVNVTAMIEAEDKKPAEQHEQELFGLPDAKVSNGKSPAPAALKKPEEGTEVKCELHNTVMTYFSTRRMWAHKMPDGLTWCDGADQKSFAPVVATAAGK